MKFFSFLIAGSLLLGSAVVWETDFEKAKDRAAAEGKFILVNFSGSDWCVPCINLRREIFESEIFKNHAQENLVLVNADFPRLKKNQLSKQQQKKNDFLAEQYDPQGHFPYTVLLDKEGKVVHSWDGFPNISAEQFITQLKAFTNANN